MTEKNPKGMLLNINDWLTDFDVENVFTAEENWAYFKMVCLIWNNSGKIENNFENFWQIFGKKTKKTARRIWDRIQKKFILEEGFITHKRVLIEMQKWQDKRDTFTERAKKAANARWAKHPVSTKARDATSMLANQNQFNINIGIANNNSQEVLALDCEIAEKARTLTEQLTRIFLPGRRSLATFANIIRYFVASAQTNPANTCWFTDAVEWAQIAKVEGKKAGGKALFVAKVKQETGYGKMPLLLNSGKQ